jgi:hypothetical protein
MTALGSCSGQRREDDYPGCGRASVARDAVRASNPLTPDKSTLGDYPRLIAGRPGRRQFREPATIHLDCFPRSTVHRAQSTLVVLCELRVAIVDRGAHKFRQFHCYLAR